MKTAILTTLVASAAAFAPAQTGRTSSAVAESKADLEALAGKLNPNVGFYDPLNLAEQDFWGKGNEATIGWLRQSEIKHGRIAVSLGIIVDRVYIFSRLIHSISYALHFVAFSSPSFSDVRLRRIHCSIELCLPLGRDYGRRPPPLS